MDSADVGDDQAQDDAVEADVVEDADVEDDAAEVADDEPVEPEATASEESEELETSEESVSDEADSDVDEIDPLDADDAETDSVGALFASLRSESVADDDTDDTEDTEDSDTDDEVEVESEPTNPPEVDDTPEAPVDDAAQEEAEPQDDDDDPAIDAPEGARRIKRVLADEQSRVMSTLKSSDDIPTVDELLGKAGEHVEMYWSVSSVHLGGSPKAPTPMVEFVREIRRKVSDALVAGNDTEAAVDSMRSIYREIKTSAVETCVTDIGRAADSASS